MAAQPKPPDHRGRHSLIHRCAFGDDIVYQLGQPTGDVARTAWEFLIRRMEDESATIQTVELKADLLLGGSVAPPPPAPSKPLRTPRLVDA